MNTAFLLIKPEACTPEFVDYATTFLTQAGIEIEELATLPGAEVARNNWAERHYSVLHYYAGAASENLSSLIHNRDDIKSVFFSIYRELWDTVMEEGRLLSAKDALVSLGNITPRELCDLWWRQSGFLPQESMACIMRSPVKLFRGFYVIYLEEHDLYVVNGFYPAMLEQLCSPGRSVCRMSLAWPESQYTWQHFETNIMGAADPAKALPSSLRYALYHQRDDFNIRHAPTLGQNGFDVSNGPLEALAQRCTWTNGRLSDDDYGRCLLQEGLPYAFVQRLLTNPTVHVAATSEITSVFDMVASKQSSEAARRLCDLYVCLQEADLSIAPAGGRLVTYDIHSPDGPVRLTASCDAVEKAQRNTAVLFVKPHACTERVCEVVVKTLARRIPGLAIETTVDVDEAQIHAKSIIDRHYGTIARYALELSPAAICVPESEQRAFAQAFGQQWSEALESGRVWNAGTALRLLGDLSPAELLALWDAEPQKVKLTSGVYVCRLSSKDGYVYIVNGFYPFCRGMFTAPGAVVRCYVISWPERELTWKQFRHDVVGGTNPSQAPQDSLRAVILARWAELGLARAPSTTENAIHASAGPVEAMVERHLWTGAPLESDVLCERFRARGLSAAIPLRWAGNPEVILGSSIYRRRAFDALENLQTSEVVRLALGVEQQERQSARETAVNRALIIIHPPACTQRTLGLVRDVLQRATITITEEYDRYAHAAASRVLDTVSMRAVARLAAESGEALSALVSEEAKVQFIERFGGVWGLLADRIHGGDAACHAFRLTAGELMKKWSGARPVRLARHCHVALVKELGVYVVNGFYPYLREQYSTPGHRVHCMAVEWKETDWTWEDFSNIVVGSEDISVSAAGSLQRTISEEWKTLGLAERPNYRAQCSVTASSGPLEGIADRALWLTTRPGLEAQQRFHSDPFTQQLLMEGVPLSAIRHYAAGYKNYKLDATIDQERQLLDDVSRHTQSSDCVRRLRAVGTHAHRTATLNYALVWVQPAFCKDALRDNMQALFLDHHVQVRSEGEVTIEDAIARGLLNSTHSALFRNACVRKASQMTISEPQKKLFAATFGIQWQTAVQLSIVINATEAVERFGEARLLRWWEVTPSKVCLSPDLYVAYMDDEGVYVVNGFFPLLRSRVHTGARVMWLNIAWEADRFGWEDFLTHVVGDDDPTRAVEGSLRHHLLSMWEQYGFSGPPNSIENGVHVSSSPMEALTERCSWWNISPEEDVLGRLLIQSGVNMDFLYDVMRNPATHIKGQPLSTVTELFNLLPCSTEELQSTLTQWQASYTLSLLPDDAVITNPTASLLVKHTEDHQLTQVLARSVSTANEYPSTFDVAVVPAQAADDAAEHSDYALLAVHPSYTVDGPGGALLQLLRDHLAAHDIAVVTECALRGAVVEERGIFAKQFERLSRYAMRRTATQTFSDPQLRRKFKEVFHDDFEATRVLSAIDVSADFGLPAKKVLAAWEACSPVVRLAPDLFVGKVPSEDLYIINGFALHFRDQFSALNQSNVYLVVSWDSRRLSYQKLLSDIIGDSYMAEAAPNSLHGIIERGWQSLGLRAAPHRYMGAVRVSESALVAMQQRDMWLSIGLLSDALGRKAMTQFGVSPYILRTALANPSTPPLSDGARCLFNAMEGLGAAPTLAHLHAAEVAYRADHKARNTAFVLVKPHATCRRFARRVEHIFHKHGVRIDEEGDVAGAAVQARGLLRYMYSAAAGYAVRDPASVRLTAEEEGRIDAALSATWLELTLGNKLVNAYRALEVLGGITPQQLYTSWKASRRRVVVRPELEITELEDCGLCVVNGYFPAMKQSFESPRTLLHWYVVSWPEEAMSWAHFSQRVIGSAEPREAAASSVRGHLLRRWRDYGLHCAPDCVQNGVHASAGPLQAMGERLHFLKRDVVEDPLGDILLRKKVHSGLLRAWMSNPDVCSRGVTAGVFEHLAAYDTSRLVRMLELLSDDIRASEAAREAGAEGPEGQAPAGGAEEVHWGSGEVLCPPPDTSLEPSTNTDATADREEEEEEMVGEGRVQHASPIDPAPHQPDEDPVLFRNSAVLLVKPHISGPDSPACKLLREVLQRRGVRIVCAAERESTTRLVDKLCPTEAYFAMRTGLCAVLHDGKDISENNKRRFHAEFGESWDDMTADLVVPKLLSAGEAMQRLRCSPQQLYAKATAPGLKKLALGRKMDIVQLAAEDDGLYVVNSRYPYERQRMEQVALASHAADGAIESTSNVLGLMVVAWDGRDMSWSDFRRRVIGDDDPAVAEAGSFRAELLRKWRSLGLYTEPDAVDNGVRCSSGPIEAFAERTAWFGLPDTIPDVLLRSARMADADAGVLTAWSSNPLVEYARGNTQVARMVEEEGPLPSTNPECTTTTRIFDLLYELNTHDVVSLAKHAEDTFTIVSAIKDLQPPPDVPLAGNNPFKSPAPRISPTTRLAQRHQAATTGGHSCAAATVTAAVTPAATPADLAVQSLPLRQRTVARSKPRQQLTDALVKDALLHAKTPADVRDVWAYYVEGEAPAAPATSEAAEVPDPTIDVRRFRRDFNALETFGLPLSSHQVQKLFDSIELRGGRMCFNEFAQVVAAYQSM